MTEDVGLDEGQWHGFQLVQRNEGEPPWRRRRRRPPRYHAWHATRAELLRRLGRSAEAKQAYDAAIAATKNSAERAYLNRKRGRVI